MVTTAAEGTTAADGTTGSSDAAGTACEDRDALRDSVKALADVDVVAEGTNGLTPAVDAVKEDLQKVRDSAASEMEPKVQAVQDSINDVEEGLGNLGDGGAADVVTALGDLSEATQSLLSSMDEGPCN